MQLPGQPEWQPAAVQKWAEKDRPFRRRGFADFLEFMHCADDELG
jgi:hypothetical protein